MESNIFFDHEFFEDVAATITAQMRHDKRLPVQLGSIAYYMIGCMYNKPLIWINDICTAKFTGFYFTNDWDAATNAEENYAYYFGPSIDMWSVLRQLWTDIPYEYQTQLMASVLGSHA